MIQKQPLTINFGQGLDTKTDEKQVSAGRFLGLQNTIFDTGGLLQKRNGFGPLTSLSNQSSTYLTTFNGGLTAIGSTINAYSTSTKKWTSKGSFQPLELSTLSLIKNSVNQSQVDTSVAPNGLVCTVYTEVNAGSSVYKYAIADTVTGQNIIQPTAIPVASGVVTGSPRIFLLTNRFVIVFTNVISATSHLQYISISTADPAQVTANADIATSYASSTTLSWDGVVVNNNLYVAYNTTTGGQAIKLTFLTVFAAAGAGAPATPTTFAGYKSTIMSLCADVSSPQSPVIYASFYNSTASTGFTLAIDVNLNVLLPPVETIASGTVLNLASAAQNGTCTVFSEVSNNYSYDSAIPSHYINSTSVTWSGKTFTSVFSSGAGTITVSSASGLSNGMSLVDATTTANIAAGTTLTVSGTTLTLSANTAGNSATTPGDTLTAAIVTPSVNTIRSVGLASKAFIVNGNIYFLSAYQSPFQPTYFLINGSTSLATAPVIVAKVAYSNGGGYLLTGLPSVTLYNNIAQIGYLTKDLIESVNKDTNVPTGTQVNGIYSQTGINLANLTIGTEIVDVVEIGSNLNISGGFGWMYDGYLPVEQNFFVWPDSIECTWSATGGAIHAQPDGATNTNAYFYQVTYEWTDNQGNSFRSAPSIPVAVTTTGSGTAGSVVINIPTLRLTYKTANPVKIVVYRWSVAQPEYYQVTSITSVSLNSTTADSIAFTDTLADATILGNNLLYTTGGVIEDVNPPATSLMTLWGSRAWMVDAEDPNLLWYSKVVIEATPVEWSDLFTLYVAPSIGASGATGPITAISQSDTNLIIFKRDSIYYVTGVGPDNTGSNSTFTDPAFVTSVVGCANQQSIVFTPAGLMFQSDKGIWLLPRSLGTPQYIGSPVERFTLGATVLSSVIVPGTNQIRFTLDSGITLMYDYYYNQWTTFINIPALSSCIYNDLHTYLNEFGQIFQETPNLYLDNSSPVLIALATSWLNLAGISGYQRIYEFQLLGEYISPHKLAIQVAFDYAPPTQQSIFSPTNFTGVYGSDSLYGQTNQYGGPGNLEQFRVFCKTQKCQAFQVTLQEIFDPSFGTAAGGGFTLSGINCVLGVKKGYRPLKSANSIG